VANISLEGKIRRKQQIKKLKKYFIGILKRIPFTNI
tara:strand:- start:587 stop:694 length:108 start_codon:yes stop_codon:yes gene_type:complete